MKTELKDVIHLYLGCEAKGVALNGKSLSLNPLNEHDLFMLKQKIILSIILVLRPLPDMTKEERSKIDEMVIELDKMIRKGDMCEGEKYAILTNYTLKQGFDLFGLIESGQAIDKTKL